MDNRIKLGVKSALAVTLSLYLAACSHNSGTSVVTVPTQPAQQSVAWQQHQQALQQLHAFRVNGSLAYLSGSTKQYARFFLDQKAANNFDLKLTTPLGGTVMILKARPNAAEIINQDGEKFHGDNLQQLVNQLTGMNIPLQSLHQWLIGLSDNPQVDRVDAQGRLIQTQVMENGINWKVTIPSYTTYKQLALPSVLELTQQNAQIRLKISNWNQ